MLCARSIRIALIAYLLVWFGVIVPGHQRGVVLVPGACPHGLSACCAAKHKDSRSPQNKSSQCAICYYTLTLSSSPGHVIVVPRLMLLAPVQPEIAESIPHLAILRSYFGRAPPLAV